MLALNRLLLGSLFKAWVVCVNVAAQTKGWFLESKNKIFVLK
jgi:hypothetical protein